MDNWLAAAAHQSPSQVWRHANCLSEYQVWTCYRIATNQLNLYRAERSVDNGCRLLEECKERKETVAHILWECPIARACWTLLIRHWTGEGTSVSTLAHYMRHCAHRRSPPILLRLRQRLIHRFHDGHTAAKVEFQRIWFVLRSVCHEHLWLGRNPAVFRGEKYSPIVSATIFWERGMRQLKAIALREHRTAATAVSGARLHACLEQLV